MSNPQWRDEILAMSTTELGQRNGEGLLALQLQAALRDEVDAAGRLAEVEAERDAALALVSEHRCDVQAEAAYDRVLRLRAERDALAAKVEAIRAVHARYFDTDGRPGYDDTTPAPEDVWRFDRDFRAALDGTETDHA